MPQQGHHKGREREPGEGRSGTEGDRDGGEGSEKGGGEGRGREGTQSGAGRSGGRGATKGARKKTIETHRPTLKTTRKV